MDAHQDPNQGASESTTVRSGANAWASRFPSRATHWKLRTRELELPRRPLLMGVLNVTPDSFSDAGQFFDPAAAIARGLELAACGADILDIGGESTRPYSQPIGADEELRRVMPILSALVPRLSIPVSIDTAKADVAREAIAAGAEIINDVSGLERDPDMLGVALQTAAGVCVMHMQGTPETMQDAPTYDNLVDEILAYLLRRRDELTAEGIDPRRIALDPGIGFGKTHQHNLTLLAHCHRFHELGCPLVVGPSRKGFIAKVVGNKDCDRTAGTIGAALSLASQGAQILRVHDVAAVRQALLVYEATGGIDGQELVLE